MSAASHETKLRLAVVGAGAIGGTVGAYLVRAGHHVTFVDTVAEHVRTIEEQGLRIEGPIERFSVRAPAFQPSEVPAPFDIILLCVKANATEAATRTLIPFLSDTGVVVSLQNGLNERIIAGLIGETRTMGAFINFGADYLQPGVIHYSGRGAFVLGELDGKPSLRLQQIHRAMLAFEPNASVSDNIWGFLWAKLAVGSMIFATALTDEGIADCYAMPEYRPLFAAIAREVLSVAVALGVRPEAFDGFEPTSFLPAASAATTEHSLDEMVAFNRRSAKTHSGVWRDLAVRKRRTEGAAQLGPIPLQARELGLQAPLVSGILAMVQEVEEGHRLRSLDNLEALEMIRLAALDTPMDNLSGEPR